MASGTTKILVLLTTIMLNAVKILSCRSLTKTCLVTASCSRMGRILGVDVL